MVAHVMCLTSTGGIPLFSRQKGEGDTMTFSKIASLYGIHMFLKSQNIKLLNTNLPDTTIMWKEFEQSITLIVIASGTTKSVLDKFLNAVFGAMILFVGIEELKNTKNIEKLKKDMRLCSPIVDSLLQCLDVGDGICSKTDIINMTECIMCQENNLFQTCLEGYMECLDSIYGCILVHGCLAVATEGWWNLSPIERKLLITAVNTEDTYSTRDIPVFLPYKSPNVAFRLVSITLINQVEVLALCGPNPSLSEIERFAIQCWKNSIDALHNAEQCYPRNLPTSVNLDSETLGFLLANYKVQKFILGKNMQYAKNRVSGSHRLDILRTFYHQAVETYILSSESECDTTDDNWKFVGVKETYLCSEYHKCYAVKHGDHILCILCASTVPTHTVRLVCQKILKTLLIDKQGCW
ncbi:protein fuzzy homolog isoform X1 [Bombus vosnesenskii]|uniref:Protein fuzzy homolog isoform X1 n=6 Tax=Pyrobombus TaxID=144703 RepID=A0A6J3K5K7_9HYME|nr:protein fuzzy homolog isoform X1 [Bombus impatiens]XP_033188160.1 protein fuzzy homolog isoform X1 [Bombus vancouverensis nearcticus]XP_033297148.1 protein fuzzy homolog isoform X1 [Bombus bifarius]XP_033347890.1 protein fuzzy homolog isoform X1 [Bombus vosnesenskii]XP_050478393.1 protein fuzzy homolog [Bombus huntii]